MDAAPGRQASVAADAATLRLLLVSDESFLCKVLAASLARDPAVSSVRCVMAADIAPALAKEADALLVYAERPQDVAMARQLRNVAPRSPIIGCGLAENAANIIAWAEAGATGFIPGATHLRQFLPRLRRILAGERFGAPRTLAAACCEGAGHDPFAARAARRNPPAAALPVATSREFEVTRALPRTYRRLNGRVLH